MSWSAYGAFLAVAVLLVLIPGPDFAVVVKNTLPGGRRRGTWAAVGVATSNCVQGEAAAAGPGAVIVAAKPLFEGIRWAGVAYLALLGLQALRNATGRNHEHTDGGPPTPARRTAVPYGDGGRVSCPNHQSEGAGVLPGGCCHSSSNRTLPSSSSSDSPSRTRCCR